jgi:hypothetical protein
MLCLQALWLSVLLPLCTTLPGLAITRRFRWSPEEKLCGAIGISLFALYLYAFAVYALSLPLWLHGFFPLVAAGAGWISRAELRRWARQESLRTLGLAFALLVLWTMALLALPRHYSGGEWGGDWQEHFDRTRFFLGALPRDFSFIGLYSLPARPPLMNAVAAHFLALSGVGFDRFQLVFTYLNLLVFFPLALLLRLFRPAGPRGRGLPVAALALFLALNPCFLQNATYTWTKLLAAFYVVWALWLFLSAERRRDERFDGGRLTAASFALSVGMLVHYSVAPYLLALGVCGLIARFPLIRVARAGLALTAPFLTWLVWSLAVYGIGDTFASNTTATGYAGSSGLEVLGRIGANLRNTLLPHPLTFAHADFLARFAQASEAGLVRDFAFTVFQHNVIFGMGTTVGALAIGRLLASFRRAEGKAPRRFWAVFLGLSAFLGIAVHSTVPPYGIASICLQPIMLLGVAWVAAGFPAFGPGARRLLAAGAVVDLALGIALHFGLESRLAGITFGPEGIAVQRSPDLLSLFALNNMVVKEGAHYVFLGDHFAGLTLVPALVALAAAAALLRGVWIKERRATKEKRRGPSGTPPRISVAQAS